MSKLSSGVQKVGFRFFVLFSTLLDIFKKREKQSLQISNL